MFPIFPVAGLVVGLLIGIGIGYAIGHSRKSAPPAPKA